MPTAPYRIFTLQKLEPYIHPEDLRPLEVTLPPSVNYPRGTILGPVTATPGRMKAYASGNSDGSQNARAILPYDVQTDASGNITFSDTAGQVGGEHGEQLTSVEVYIGGFFQTSELVGLDATAVTGLGKIVVGDTTSGVLYVG